MSKAEPSSLGKEELNFKWPAYAYVPGKNERHPDDFFDDIKRSVSGSETLSQISQSRAFLCGFSFFEKGFYWEAHEVWEAVWLAISDTEQEKLFVQALIQTTNAYLKLRMQRPKASRRLCHIALALFAECDQQELMGLDKNLMVRQIEDLQSRINLTI